MTSEDLASDPVVVRLREARRSPAVLKARLATLRSWLPRTPIFALEGPEDKPVLFQWKQRLRPELNYEPFPCGGKGQVLALRSSLRRDMGDLEEGVYFIVDRDFDEPGDEAGDPMVFITDRYSLENYLVTPEVLEEILKNELHCHAIPDVRAGVCTLFSKVYAEFLSITRSVNLTLFCARRLKVRVDGGLPDKVSKLAIIKLQSVEATATPLSELVPLAAEIPAEGMKELEVEFSALSPTERYRGKFALMFFVRWLEILAEERLSLTTGLMNGAETVTKLRINEVTLGTMASRSPMPVGFGEFLRAVAT